MSYLNVWLDVFMKHRWAVIVQEWLQSLFTLPHLHNLHNPPGPVLPGKMSWCDVVPHYLWYSHKLITIYLEQEQELDHFLMVKWIPCKTNFIIFVRKLEFQIHINLPKILICIHSCTHLVKFVDLVFLWNVLGCVFQIIFSNFLFNLWHSVNKTLRFRE